MINSVGKNNKLLSRSKLSSSVETFGTALKNIIKPNIRKGGFNVLSWPIRKIANIASNTIAHVLKFKK